jgi:UPF0042 nucleotide-binding protein
VSEFLILAGMSGAGRSQAGDALEDLGWFVIDNLPPALMPKVAELAHGGTAEPTQNVAFVAGAGLTVDELAAAREQLQASGGRVRVLFLDASTEVLIRRYESTKRRHPNAADRPLQDAIELERVLMRPVREAADLVLDTSDFTIYECRARIASIFGDDSLGETMQTTVLSFGYKHGLPSDVDMVLDCRFLPNPHWVDDLRPLSGLDAPVRDYLWADPLTEPFLERVGSLLELLVPAYRDEGKAYLTIAVGCTGGRHRSVAIAEALGTVLGEFGVGSRVIHRDIEK